MTNLEKAQPLAYIEYIAGKKRLMIQGFADQFSINSVFFLTYVFLCVFYYMYHKEEHCVK